MTCAYCEKDPDIIECICKISIRHGKKIQKEKSVADVWRKSGKMRGRL